MCIDVLQMAMHFQPVVIHQLLNAFEFVNRMNNDVFMGMNVANLVLCWGVIKQSLNQSNEHFTIRLHSSHEDKIVHPAHFMPVGKPIGLLFVPRSVLLVALKGVCFKNKNYSLLCFFPLFDHLQW